MSSAPDVPAAYDQIAEQYFADRSTALRERPYLERALTDVRAGARVLDFGCGTGRPIGEYFVRRGCLVTGIDGSKTMLRFAQQCLPSARLLHARLEDATFDETYAAVVAWDSLFHVDRMHHAAIYRRIAGALMPGGRFLLTTGGTEDAGFTDRMHGETFFYSSWTPQRVTELLEEAGFTIELNEVDQPEGRGHVVVLARRR